MSHIFTLRALAVAQSNQNNPSNSWLLGHSELSALAYDISNLIDQATNESNSDVSDLLANSLLPIVENLQSLPVTFINDVSNFNVQTELIENHYLTAIDSYEQARYNVSQSIIAILY